MLKNLCVVTAHYPTANDPMFVFVKETVNAIADQGINCVVVCPQSILKRKRPMHWVDTTPKGNKVDVYQPYYLSLSFVKKLLPNYNVRARGMAVHRAVKKLQKKAGIKFDVLYGHFWDSGIFAIQSGKKLGIPAIAVTGESVIQVNSYLKKKQKECKSAHIGTICVSSKNKTESVGLGLINPNEAVVFPNSINPKAFYKMDKYECRKELGFPSDAFIVAFTGAFSDRKGSKRLSEALDQLDGVNSIFIGKGTEKPSCSNILFCGPLPHDQICKYLNAADAFVLPTRAEGCCNAIIEAMACGLAIVSSDKEFNDDILNENNAIRIDSDSVEEIRSAVERLQKDPILCRKMGEESLRLAQELTLENRTRRIISYIDSKIGSK